MLGKQGPHMGLRAGGLGEGEHWYTLQILQTQAAAGRQQLRPRHPAQRELAQGRDPIVQAGDGLGKGVVLDHQIQLALAELLLQIARRVHTQIGLHLGAALGQAADQGREPGVDHGLDGADAHAAGGRGIGAGAFAQFALQGQHALGLAYHQLAAR